MTARGWKLPTIGRRGSIYRMLLGFETLGVNRFDVGIGHWHEDGTKGEFWSGRHETTLTRDEVERKLGWFGRENAHGGDIYIRPHGDAAWPLVFVDDLTEYAARDIASIYKTMIVETSCGSYQSWIATDRRTIPPERHQIQKTLVRLLRSNGNAGAGDPASTARNKFGRLAGYRNQKPSRNGDWVNVVTVPHEDGKLLPTEKLLSMALAAPLSAPRGAAVVLHPDGGDQVQIPVSTLPTDRVASVRKGRVGRQESGPDTSDSAREFGWVCGMLRCRRFSRDEIVKRLTDAANARQRRQYPQEAERYADLTVTSAEIAIAAECGYPGTRKR